MSQHMYKVVELVGTSDKSFEAAATGVVEAAAAHLKDLRIAEITAMDMQIADGRVISYRAKVKVSLRYHPEIHE